MNCKRCNVNINLYDKFCHNCGLKLKEEKIQNIENNQSFTLIGSFFTIISILIFLLIGFIYWMSNSTSKSFFSDTIYSSNATYNETFSYSYYTTSINYDNTYQFVAVNSKKDAVSLIKNDSSNEKSKCANDLITEIENNIVAKYNISAVNICEFSINYALDLEKALDKTFAEFPSAKGYMTNLSLMNADEPHMFMAAFMPIFQFANGKSNINFYPWVIKSSLLLNSYYYLNQEFLDETVISAEEIGYFPKNANGKSIIAHELGHYLSFVALLKSFNVESILLIKKEDLNTILEINDASLNNMIAKDIVHKAYNNYLMHNPNEYISEHDFRSSISDYAVIGDIYDETIAEAYHDYFLNGNNASLASIEIINELKRRL